MAGQNQFCKSCVLRVDVKCCSACQANAKRKLQRIPGVSAIEYNAEEGFMTVSGDVNPMTLVDKFDKWGRKAELVSVQNQPIVQNSPGNSSATSSNQNHGVEGSQSPVPNNPEREEGDKSKQKKNKKKPKCWLLPWIWKKTNKAKLEPFQWPATVGETRTWQFPVRLENGRAWPSTTTPPPPPAPLMNPQHKPVYGGGPPAPPYSSYFGVVPPPLPPYGAGMFQVAPPPLPPSPPYFTSRQPLSPHAVNPMVHYKS